MDVRIRPGGLGHRQPIGTHLRHLAVNLFFLVISLAANTESLRSAAGAGDTPANVPVVMHADHRVAVGIVGEGHEGISLSAQLAAESTLSASGVYWRIWRANGETVFSGTAAEATALVLPGSYHVAAKYGPATFEDAFNVEPGHHLSVNLILNIGALRILPKIAGVDDAAVKTVSRIFALTGLDRGKLVALSTIPGEPFELSAGQYRIESRFEHSNAVAVSDIVIKPGIMSAVEFKHKAGVARLTHADNLSGLVTWIISDKKGVVAKLDESGTRDVVLQPGHYKADASFNGGSYQTEFDLLAGETQTITLEY
jgi:hypothetical protein